MIQWYKQLNITQSEQNTSIISLILLTHRLGQSREPPLCAEQSGAV